MEEDFWPKIYELATELGVKKPAMCKWRQRKAIPYRYHIPIINLAKERNYNIRAEDLARDN